MNAAMMEEYLEFIANRRLVQIGLPEQFDSVSNPFPWMSEIMDLRKRKRIFSKQRGLLSTKQEEPCLGTKKRSIETACRSN